MARIQNADVPELEWLDFQQTLPKITYQNASMCLECLSLSINTAFNSPSVHCDSLEDRLEASDIGAQTRRFQQTVEVV